MSGKWIVNDCKYSLSRMWLHGWTINIPVHLMAFPTIVLIESLLMLRTLWTLQYGELFWSDFLPPTISIWKIFHSLCLRRWIHPITRLILKNKYIYEKIALKQQKSSFQPVNKYNISQIFVLSALLKSEKAYKIRRN